MAIDSPLPQLDKPFDYLVPAGLSVVPGTRVRVPFGRGAKLVDGFVLALSDRSEFPGDLAQVAELVSPVPVLTSDIHELCCAIAQRQAVTLHDVLKLAVPKRSVRTEKNFLLQGIAKPNPKLSHVDLLFGSSITQNFDRATAIVEPRHIEAQAIGVEVSLDRHLRLPGWVAAVVGQVFAQLKNGKSSIVVVPDFRDLALLVATLRDLGLAHLLVETSSALSASERYQAHLRCLEQPLSIVVGSRTAAYSPVQNLGLLLLWNDMDESHQELASPYVHSREVLLLRAKLASCKLLFLGHARSVEIARLLEIGYLTDVSPSFAKPRVAVTAPGVRVDGAAFVAVREALSADMPVLVQVANLGVSSSLSCLSCGDLAKCPTCHGLIVLDSLGKRSCRWCSAPQVALRCMHCKSDQFRQGRAGSTRTAQELGKAFPGTTVWEATGERVVKSLPAGKSIVVATPGSQPFVQGGYGAVVILDGAVLLARETLRASERAIDAWTTAIAALNGNGRAVLVGVPNPLGQVVALWQLAEWAQGEYRSRRELSLPPAVRLGSAAGDLELVRQFSVALAAELSGLVKEVGIREVTNASSRFVFKFEYSAGAVVANFVKTFLLKHASVGKVVAGNGRSSRALRVRLDDSEII